MIIEAVLEPTFRSSKVFGRTDRLPWDVLSRVYTIFEPKLYNGRLEWEQLTFIGIDIQRGKIALAHH